MLYTSYYARIRKFPESFIPVAISRGIPKWYDGLTYNKLAPLWETVDTYKNNVDHDPAYWQNWYDEQYIATVLDKLDPLTVQRELQELVGEDNIPVLLCYEKSSDFCHRQLVVNWFARAHIQAREAIEEDFVPKEAALQLDEEEQEI